MREIISKQPIVGTESLNVTLDSKNQQKGSKAPPTPRSHVGTDVSLSSTIIGNGTAFAMGSPYLTLNNIKSGLNHDG